MAVRMPGLALGGRPEHGGHVVVALDIRLLGEIEVAPVGLAFAGDCSLEIVQGLRAFQRGHGEFSLLIVLEQKAICPSSLSIRRDRINHIPARMIVNSLELFKYLYSRNHDSFGATRTITSTRLTCVPGGAPGIRASST